jgi:hypothetical protein
MHNNVADQNGETVQLVRFGPSTSRPQSPPQSLWRGSLPQGVKKIMTRTALAQHHRVSYAKWASNFVLLTNEFITQVMKGAAKTADQSSPRKWTGYKFVDWYFCDVGDDYLWVQKQDGGWTVELCYPDADPDARILTIENMPVLCPDAPSAAALAEGCYFKPPANLVWHSYF